MRLSEQPFIGVSGVLKIGETAVGYIRGVRLSVDSDIVREYYWGSSDPGILEAGNRRYRLTAEKAYVDATYANHVKSGSKLTVELQPKGAGAGKPKITLADAVLSSWDYRQTQDGVVMETIEGEAKSIAFGTQT
jgi:hypothetical protein